MIYSLIYNDQKLGCFIHDKETFDNFLKLVTKKEHYPICILRISQTKSPDETLLASHSFTETNQSATIKPF